MRFAECRRIRGMMLEERRGSKFKRTPATEGSLAKLQNGICRTNPHFPTTFPDIKHLEPFRPNYSGYMLVTTAQ